MPGNVLAEERIYKNLFNRYLPFAGSSCKKRGAVV